MRTVKKKPVRRKQTKKTASKACSFKDLKAFGIWSERAEVQEPVLFTQKLRQRMENGSNNP